MLYCQLLYKNGNILINYIPYNREVESFPIFHEGIRL